MNQYNAYELREVLNFDTNIEKFFSLVDRNQIHRAISKDMDCLSYDLPKDLKKKISDARSRIKETGFKKLSFYMD